MIKFPDGIHDDKDLRATAGGRGTAFWVVAGIFILATLLGADLIWMAFEEAGTLLLEFVAERMEHFFQKSFGLDLYHAQMATAYSGALIGLFGGFFLLRKFAPVARHLCVDGRSWWRARSAEAVRDWHAGANRLRVWWSTLDLLNKSAVLVALIVMAIPLALLLSYGLGMAVAEIL